MVIHASLALCTVTSLFVGGVAFAQQTGTTTGPSAGKNVEPSTTTEKGYESEQQRLERGASLAASAAADPVLRRCPGPKAAQRAGRENKRLQSPD